MDIDKCFFLTNKRLLLKYSGRQRFANVADGAFDYILLQLYDKLVVDVPISQFFTERIHRLKVSSFLTFFCE